MALKVRKNDLKHKIKKSYKKNANIYDDYMTSSKLWSKIIAKIIWGFKDEEYVKTLLPLIPNELRGKLLDVPVGTAVFTYEKYRQMSQEDIFCIDYSKEMLKFALKRFNSLNLNNVHCKEGDVGNLPFENDFFDIVLSMNGLHVFPDKEKAFEQIHRVLKPGGKLIGCLYVKGERVLTDFFAQNIFVRNGTITPPFMTKKEFQSKLKEQYTNIKIWSIKSIVCFECNKK